MKCLELIFAAEGNFQKGFLQIVCTILFYFNLVLVHCGICYKGTSKSRIRIVYSSKSPPWKVPTVKWTMGLSISNDYTLPWPPHSRPHNISAFNIWALWLNYNIWALWLNYNIWASCSILQYLGLMFSTSYRDHKKSSIHIMIMYYVGIIEI